MLDSITIVIQLTGLMMIVPPNGPGGPTHVLMPRSQAVSHDAYVGYRMRSSAEPCAGDAIRGFCFVQMNGYELEPLPRSAGVPNPEVPRIPRTVLNLSQGSGGRRVHAGHLGQNPGRDTLQSRITLPSGMVTDTCQMGRWRFDPTGLPEAEPSRCRTWLKGASRTSVRIAWFSSGGPCAATLAHGKRSGRSTPTALAGSNCSSPTFRAWTWS